MWINCDIPDDFAESSPEICYNSKKATFYETQSDRHRLRLFGACGELVGTDPVCDGVNLRRIGDVFERYGSFGEEDALVGVGGC